MKHLIHLPSTFLFLFFFFKPEWESAGIFFFQDVRKTTQKCVLPTPVPNLINLQEVPAPAPVPLGGPLISVPCHSVFAGYERSPGTIPNSEPTPGGRGWRGGCPLHRFSAACGYSFPCGIWRATLPRQKLPGFLLSRADGSAGTRLGPQNAPRAAARCFGSASSTLSVLDPAPSACTGHDREHGCVPEALKKRERGRGCCKPRHICQPPPPRHSAVGRLCTNPAQPVGKAFHFASVPSDFWRLASRL